MAENFDSEFINLYQPKKRFIIPIDNFHVPKKLFKLFRKNTYTFKINNNFKNVISKCQLANRKDNGTWINNIILDSYLNLHYEKIAHSVECYDQNQLIVDYTEYILVDVFLEKVCLVNFRTQANFVYFI